MRPIALITGASSGIGAEFARQLAARGYDLVLVARRKERLDGLAGTLAKDHGATSQALAADLVTDDGMRAVEQRIATGDIDLLVNNAGFGTLGKFFRVEIDGQDHMQRLHVLATLRLTHAALAVMTQRGRGGIINVSSIAAFWQAPGSVGYCASKRWINSFTEGLAIELQAAGLPVVVQALCPGYTYSEFHDVAVIDRKLIPGFLWSQSADVVKASLDGLDQGKTIVIPGWQNRVAAFLLRHLPGFILRSVAIRSQRRLGRH